uniref:Uncharacterized protein n=1 Tax=Romanomermis culicivorax TaxID=13658 RepID=A0A915K7T6_ROMCU
MLVIFSLQDSTLSFFHVNRRNGCFTRFSGEWIELPRIFDDCDLNTAVEKLKILKLNYDLQIDDEEKSQDDPDSVLEIQSNESPILSKTSTLPALDMNDFTSQNRPNTIMTYSTSLSKDPQVQKNCGPSYGNSDSKPSIPEMYLQIKFENEQTVGHTARFWFGASSAGIAERYAMRVAILRKIPMWIARVIVAIKTNITGAAVSTIIRVIAAAAAMSCETGGCCNVIVGGIEVAADVAGSTSLGGSGSGALNMSFGGFFKASRLIGENRGDTHLRRNLSCAPGAFVRFEYGVAVRHRGILVDDYGG